MKEQIKKDLINLGIKKGDTILMHSSFRSLGDIEGGAKTFFDAFLEVLGEEGTLVLPSLSYSRVNDKNPVFDVDNTPSCVGYLPEYFRTSVDGVIRSMHATHSCCAVGKNAEEIVKNHELDDTPVGKNSPFRKIPDYNGKILMLGCGTRCNTSMHGVEELSEPPYCMDRENTIDYILKKGDQSITVTSYRHHFLDKNGKHVQQRYDRLLDLMDKSKIKTGKVLAAESYLLDAKEVWEKGYQKLLEDPLYFVDYPDNH